MFVIYFDVYRCSNTSTSSSDRKSPVNICCTDIELWTCWEEFNGPAKYAFAFVDIFSFVIILRNCIFCFIFVTHLCLYDGYQWSNYHLGPQRRQLRSTTARSPTVLRTRTQFGRRAFSVCGPDIWNSLPVNIRLIDSHPSFRRALKTHLFNIAFT